MKIEAQQIDARDLERENARLREALEAAGNSLSAVCGLLETYPRPSNDPNGRTLLDAREHSGAASRAARAALAPYAAARDATVEPIN